MGIDRGAELVETSAVLLKAAGGVLPITSLMKALFYTDLMALRDLGATLTSTSYLALKAGPVVAKYEKRVVGALERAGLAQQDECEDGSKPVCLIADPRITAISDEGATIARDIAKWAAKHTPTWLSDFSHLNTGWKIAWDQGLGGHGPARLINMRIAMQQILDKDPWMDEPLSQECESLVRATQSASGAAW